MSVEVYQNDNHRTSVENVNKLNADFNTICKIRVREKLNLSIKVSHTKCHVQTNLIL